MDDIFAYLEDKRPNTVMGLLEEDGKALYRFIKDKEIKTIVETGIHFGFSSTYFLDANPELQLISIDPFIKSRSEMLVPEEYYCRWVAIQNYSQKCLDKVLKAFSQVDMFFHDGDHFYDPMMFEYKTAVENNVKYIASDDVDGVEAGTVWQDFLMQNNYKEILRGARFAVAERGV